MAVSSSGNLSRLQGYEPADYRTLSAPRLLGFLPRLIFFLGLGLTEAVLYYFLTNGAAVMRHGASPQLQAQVAIFISELRDLVVACMAGIVIFNWSTLPGLIDAIADSSQFLRSRIAPLLLHIAFVGLLIAWASIDPRYVSSPHAAVLWSLGRLALFSFAMLTGLVAAVPRGLWLHWYFSSRGGIAAGTGFGIAAYAGKCFVRNIWWSTDRLTLLGSYWILRLIGEHPIVDVSQRLLGAKGFVVRVDPQCAGFEGVVLITLVLGFYFWMWRDALRFPHVLALFPIGIAMSWVLNLVRIATLIVIGIGHPDFALETFHSIAGWALFNLIGIGLIAASNEFEVFRSAHAIQKISTHSANPAAAYLLPLVVAIATGMLTGALRREVSGLYPLPVIVTGCILFRYRHEYRAFEWTWRWQALAIGTVVGVVWLLSAPAGANLTPGAEPLSPVEQPLWIVMRLIGTLITVPMAEELAFRGYLLRRLVGPDFETVDPRRFTWTSFLLSSILFGAMHDRWMAGTFAGMAFALAVYPRGKISDAIIAHSISNAIIAAYVLASGNWWLWS